MLAKTEQSQQPGASLAGAVRAGARRRGRAESAVPRRRLLARRARLHLGHRHGARPRRDRGGAAARTRERTGASGFALAPNRTAPRQVTRAGTPAIEAIFRFETAQGRGSGVVRLVTDAGEGVKAWTLLTALDELKGHEETIGRARPTGQSYSRDFRGPNWLDLRKAAQAYADRDPDVLVVGGGQAGLSIAARLTQLQVDTLIVDREARVGDNWRNRYHALTLHNQVQVNHLPYMPFPPNWPTYIPKDKLANWFETYVESMELNYWTGTEFLGGTYDETEQRWTVTLRRDGETRALRPRHVVMATGVSGIPSIPDIPSLKDFAGTVLHSTQYQDGEAWSGKRAHRHRHRQQRARHRAGSRLERRAGHPGAAQPDPGRQHRAERAARLRAL